MRSDNEHFIIFVHQVASVYGMFLFTFLLIVVLLNVFRLYGTEVCVRVISQYKLCVMHAKLRRYLMLLAIIANEVERALISVSSFCPQAYTDTGLPTKLLKKLLIFEAWGTQKIMFLLNHFVDISDKPAS